MAGNGAAGAAANSGAGNGGQTGGAGNAADSGTPTDAGGKRCGTRAGVQCAADEFCNFEPDVDCGGTDRGGSCQVRPQICTDIYKPVCGCDDHTYSSDCRAHGAGMSVKHDGSCTPDECTAAGGRAVYGTDASQPTCDGDADSWSISGGIEAVICCLAKTRGKTCGGIAALQCSSGEFCNYEPPNGQGCDGTVADSGGTCQTQPQVCTQEYAPVCGCDHRSYGNACAAHSMGIAVLHSGACTEQDCAALGGKVVVGAGPAPMCSTGETEVTSVAFSNGMIPIEGAICCVPGATKAAACVGALCSAP
jgi:hypothetical protein